ncbi:MAG: hypothetical protein ACOYO1_20690 [Bacteroidales bacterium]
MGLKAGIRNNPNGRPKGSQNKVTTELKEKVLMFIDNNFDQLQADFNTVDAKDRLIIMERLLKYAIPTKIEQEVIKDEDDIPSINISIAGIDMKLND